MYKGKPKSETIWIKLFRLWTNYQEDPKDPKEYENPFDLFEKYIEKNFKKKYLDRLLRKEDIQQLKIQFENLKTPDLIGLIGLDDTVIRQIIKTQFLFILHRKNIQIIYQDLLNTNAYILYLPPIYVMNTENKPTVIANNKIQGYTLEEIILKGIKYGQKIKRLKQLF